MSTVVLLPGLDGTGVLFRPFLAALPADVAPVVVSYPGDRPSGYEALVDHVLAALPADAPFVLLGESFSGPLALMVAARRPSGLAGVILCATFVRSPHPWIPRWCAPCVRPWVMRCFPRASQAKALLGGRSTPALRALIGEALARVESAVLAARLREVLRVDVSGLLAACPVPVHYLRGDHDMVVPARNLRDVLRLAPSATVTHLDAPHQVLQTQPAAAAAAVAAFVRERCARGG